ncbi:Uracil-DNA glycosylase [Rhodospirillaceae bacterium LM-1]|nr:Uracil-DNA glycosylase [Rhodospirillaceae bacterium LM-1]
MPLKLDPPHDCALCPRLAAFLAGNRAAHPDWHNAPVPAFGPLDARLLIVGLAPGLKGANRTGRPFTGDYAGDLLYATLIKLGLAKGAYGQRPDDGLQLMGCRITNAVRCVPPENKPTPAEAKTCGQFLKGEIAAMPTLASLLVLGRISHEASLRALGLKPSAYAFGHAKIHVLPSGIRLIDSYHCSRYNTQTNRLTPAMFEEAVRAAAQN